MPSNKFCVPSHWQSDSQSLLMSTEMENGEQGVTWKYFEYSEHTGSEYEIVKGQFMQLSYPKWSPSCCCKTPQGSLSWPQMLGKPPLNWLHSLNICVNLSFLCHIHQIKSFQHIVMKTNTFHIRLTFYHISCQDSSPGWLHRPAFLWLNLTSILNLGRLINLPTPFKHLLPLYYIWIIKSYSMLHKYFRLFLHIF